MIEPMEMTDEEYFKLDAVSKSLLAKMDCPDKAWEKVEETPAMFLGTLAHCAILEPEEFDNRYIVDPKMPKRSNADKEAWAEWQKANEGKRIISEIDKDIAFGMAAAVRNHPVASGLLSVGKAEVAYQWTDERTNERCKCKADYVQGETIVDLKTCVSASPEEFARACANFKYHWQHAWYMRGTGAERFVFIAVEKKHPFIVEVYELDDEAVEAGLIGCDDALDRLIDYKMLGDFRGYTGEQRITPLSLPAWAVK